MIQELKLVKLDMMILLFHLEDKEELKLKLEKLLLIEFLKKDHK